VHANAGAESRTWALPHCPLPCVHARCGVAAQLKGRRRALSRREGVTTERPPRGPGRRPCNLGVGGKHRSDGTLTHSSGTRDPLGSGRGRCVRAAAARPNLSRKQRGPRRRDCLHGAPSAGKGGRRRTSSAATQSGAARIGARPRGRRRRRPRRLALLTPQPPRRARPWPPRPCCGGSGSPPTTGASSARSPGWPRARSSGSPRRQTS
jgi:hypothetical protein